ncbi:MAG: hypothetical protein Q9226_002638 [Calogaya cf. arnoldii]
MATGKANKQPAFSTAHVVSPHGEDMARTPLSVFAERDPSHHRFSRSSRLTRRHVRDPPANRIAQRSRKISNKEAPIISLRPFTTQQIKTLQRIVFRFQSKDQGWSSFHEHHGSYNGSWTWFEAVVRSGDNDGSDDHSAEDKVKKRVELQRNRHAGMRLENYEIVFEHGDPRIIELKSLLEAGDVLELRACARFPGWTNYVEQASIEMWCLDDLVSTVRSR